MKIGAKDFIFGDGNTMNHMFRKVFTLRGYKYERAAMVFHLLVVMQLKDV